MSRRPSFAGTILSLLLYLYPRRFRDDFGDELLATFARRAGSSRRRLLACRDLLDTLLGAPLAWRDEWRRPRRRPGETWMKNLGHEARLSARVLLTRQRSFTVLCVLTLALGLGAATAMFSVVHGVLLAPLPYGDPARIVLLYQNPPGQGWGQFSGPNFSRLRNSMRSFEILAGYNDYRNEGADLTADEPVRRIRTLRVGSGYFEALGVKPLFGRTFELHEEIPPDAATRDTERFAMVTAPSSPVVILSHRFWQRQYGGDRSILGSTLELDRSPLTIVGVMPARLGGHAGGAPDVWMPLDLAPGGQNVNGNQYMSVVARLAEGVSVEQAQAELDRETERLRGLDPNNNDLKLYAAPLHDVVAGSSRSMLYLLFGAVGAMLAIACINIANLFLARGIGRQRELRLRAALGAERLRLFAGSLIESLWVGVAGGLLGLAAAWGAVRWLQDLRPDALPRFDALGLSMPVFAFCAGVVLLTVLVVGLWPALRAARVELSPALAVRGNSLGGPGERRMRDLGVSLQVALSLVLLTAGGLLARSFLTLSNVDMGFDPDPALTFQLRLPDYAYDDPERRIEFYNQLFPRLDALPDIAASGATSKLPGSGHRNFWGIGIEGYEPEEGTFAGAEIRTVAGRSHEALSMPMLAGRALGAADQTHTDRVVVVNQALVDTYFEDRNPIGKLVSVGSPPARTIVGVVADARHDPREHAVAKVYVPQPQIATRNWDLSFVVTRAPESTASWGAIRSQVESVVADLDRRLVVYDVRPLAEVAAEPIARQRFGAQLMLIFAGLSLLLAAVGLFGALAYSLNQRRNEIGVRMALGADRRRVLASVLLHGMRVFALGAAVGLLGVMAVRRWLESVLFEIQPGDPRTIAFALGTLLLVALIATFEPARRASRLDPAKILRDS